MLPLPTLILLKCQPLFPPLLAVACWLGDVARGRRLVVVLDARAGAEALGQARSCGCRSWARSFARRRLGRFARTLGTLARSGVSLLPALKIVENTIGNRVLAQQMARVAEETRGGRFPGQPAAQAGDLSADGRADDRRRRRDRQAG